MQDPAQALLSGQKFHFVIPAKAGIQFVRVGLDPGLRRDDEISGNIRGIQHITTARPMGHTANFNEKPCQK